MKSIETILTVGPDRTAVLRLPDDVEPGRHAAILIIDAPNPPPHKPLDLPLHDVGTLTPNSTFRREDLYGDDDVSGR